MKKTNYFFAAILLSALGFASCSKDDTDTKNPVITIISPIDDDHFHAGDFINFEAEFSDDSGLKQFKLEIHPGDGHDHKTSQISLQDWNYLHIQTISGIQEQIQMNILIPLDAEIGVYHFVVYVTDEAGNEAFVSLDIEIEEQEIEP